MAAKRDGRLQCCCRGCAARGASCLDGLLACRRGCVESCQVSAHCEAPVTDTPAGTRLIQTTRRPTLQRLLSLVRTTASLRPPRWKGALRRFGRWASKSSITNTRVWVTASGSAAVPVAKDGSTTPFGSGKSSCGQSASSSAGSHRSFGGAHDMIGTVEMLFCGEPSMSLSLMAR